MIQPLGLGPTMPEITTTLNSLNTQSSRDRREL
jgi:hypothetical protein